jgi:hypothetical protein
MHEVEAERETELLADEMARRSGSRRGVAVLPGLALISATSSFIVCAGTDGWTASTSVVNTINVTGSKSFSNS